MQSLVVNVFDIAAIEQSDSSAREAAVLFLTQQPATRSLLDAFESRAADPVGVSAFLSGDFSHSDGPLPCFSGSPTGAPGTAIRSLDNQHKRSLQA
jgi:hypothetical protein